MLEFSWLSYLAPQLTVHPVLLLDRNINGLHAFWSKPSRCAQGCLTGALLALSGGGGALVTIRAAGVHPLQKKRAVSKQLSSRNFTSKRICVSKFRYKVKLLSISASSSQVCHGHFTFQTSFCFLSMCQSQHSPGVRTGGNPEKPPEQLRLWTIRISRPGCSCTDAVLETSRAGPWAAR